MNEPTKRPISTPVTNLRRDRFAEAIKANEALAALLFDQASKRIVALGSAADKGLENDLQIASHCVAFARILTGSFIGVDLTLPQNSDKIPVKQ